MFLNGTDLLLGFLNKVNSKIPPVPRFYLVQRSPTFATIQSFERSHLDTLLIAIVIREFRQWQPFLPRTLGRDNTSPKHVLENLINTLGLLRSLQVISRTAN
jgi:hypothetical protein